MDYQSYWCLKSKLTQTHEDTCGDKDTKHADRRQHTLICMCAACVLFMFQCLTSYAKNPPKNKGAEDSVRSALISLHL